MTSVLIVRLTALGDVVLTEPLARALRASLPGATVDLLTEARLVSLLQASRAYDQVIGWDRRGADAGIRGLFRVRSRLGTYDLVIDLQNKLRTRALLWLLRAGRRVTLAKRSPWAAIEALFGRDPPLVGRHAIDLYLDAARRAVPALPAPVRTEWPIERRRGGRLFGLGAGTTHATKRWPLEHFVELARLLSARYPGARFVPIGGASDRADLDALTRAIGPAQIDPRDVAALDPIGLLEVLRELDVMISTDSGAAHMAQAIGVPTLVLFGPTSPERWGPRAAPHRALSLKLYCSPCSNTGGPICPRRDHSQECLKALMPADVAQAVFAEIDA